MRLLKRLLGIVLMGAMLATPSILAKTKTPPDGRAKTVHVKGYKTKKGKNVRPHNRRAPKAKN
jgi:hypothetical protein